MKTLTAAFILAILSIAAPGQGIQMDIPGVEVTTPAVPDAPASGFLKLPYLIFEGTNTEMRVIWQLSETENCTISWGTDNTYSLGTALTTEYNTSHQHGYTISGLTPATKYLYKVICGSVIHEASFLAAPPDAATDVKFFVYGDTRTDYINHNLNAAAMIADYSVDPGFQTLTLFTGDHVTYGAYETSWQTEFFTGNAPDLRQRMAEVPFVSCLGNHEMYQNLYSGIDYSTSLFGKYFPFPFVDRRYWSFDYGPMHVLVLDQYPGYYVMIPPIGYLDSAQIAWVEQDLSGSSKPWKIIILHEPGWSCEGHSSGYSHPNNEDVQNLLQPLCEEYGVQIVFTAHNHYFARACKNGIYHITTAGGGAPLYEIEEEFPNVMYTRRVHHYCRIEISGDTLSVTATTPFGEVIDSFSVARENPPEHLLGFLTKEEGPGNISDVVIMASGQATHPDSTGYYGICLEPGTYETVFSLDSYQTIVASATVSDGTETQLDTNLLFMVPIGEPVNNNNEAQACISPNPSDGMVQISCYFGQGGHLRVEILNLAGMIILEKEMSAESAGRQIFPVDIRHLPSGIYLCRLQAGNQTVVKRIIKL